MSEVGAEGSRPVSYVLSPLNPQSAIDTGAQRRYPRNSTPSPPSRDSSFVLGGSSAVSNASGYNEKEQMQGILAGSIGAGYGPYPVC